MQKVAAPIDALTKVLASGVFAAEELDLDVLSSFGVFVVKNAFSQETIAKYRDYYYRDLGGPDLVKDAYHRTKVHIGEGHAMRDIASEPAFVALASKFFGGNVGSDWIRVIKKDKVNFDSVFLHQDISYQIGSFERYSFFIPLTRCHIENGGIVLYPGTHNFGYLGDAGEIADILPTSYPRIESDASPGDVLIMHSGTWHESPPNQDKTDRVYLEVHVQDINEASTRIEIVGERTSEWRLQLEEDEIFSNSRAQRIRGLHQELDRLRALQA